MYLKELKIGNVNLKNNILLAPMAGITNLPFRLICEKYVNENMETTVPGLFACGDCTGGLLQISKAIYEGTKAGLAVLK